MRSAASALYISLAVSAVLFAIGNGLEVNTSAPGLALARTGYVLVAVNIVIVISLLVVLTRQPKVEEEDRVVCSPSQLLVD